MDFKCFIFVWTCSNTLEFQTICVISLEMGKTRRNSRRLSGGGYLTDQQYFDPSFRSPTAGIFGSGAPLSTAPTVNAIRPVLYATYGGSRRRGMKSRSMRGTTRRLRGGFSPSVMGGFIPNAQAAIVPAALYLAYHTMVPKGSRGRAALRSFSRKASAALKKFSGK